MGTQSDHCGSENESVRPDPQLVAQIEQAFAAVPYPGDDGICQGVTDEGQCPLSEEERIAAVFRGRHWKEVPLDDLARYSATLCFLTPAAYRFYLPAYLLAVIRLSLEPLERVPRVGDVEDELLYSLTPATDSSDLWDYRHQRIDALTPDQKAAVQAFLHWVYWQRLRQGVELFSSEKSVLAYWGSPAGHPPPAQQEVNEALPAVIDGARRADDGEWVNDGPNCQLILGLIAHGFIPVDQREGGWPKLYQDPTDGSYWELAYPYAQMWGGGPPVLTRLSAEQVQTLYRLPALERRRSQSSRP
jgi:hypothetical protein